MTSIFIFLHPSHQPGLLRTDVCRACGDSGEKSSPVSDSSHVDNPGTDESEKVAMADFSADKRHEFSALT